MSGLRLLLRRSAAHLVRGFLMGLADIVPGVSGGTVAVVLGVYGRLVHAIRTGSAALTSALRARWREASDHLGAIDWWFLVPLLVGILVALVSLAAPIEHLLEREPQNTSATFLGLVAGSIAIALRLVSEWTPARIASTVMVAVLAFLILGLRSDAVVDPAAVFFFGAGAVAIIAMILPGVSGAFILVMLGMYKEGVLAAFNDRRVGVLAIFVLGAVVGLALFSTLLDRLLHDHRDTTMAVLIGLMSGSLRVLWPWPDGTETARLAAPDSAIVPLLLALAGAVVVLVIGRLDGRSLRLESARTSKSASG